MNRFKKLPKKDLVQLLTAHLLRYPVIGVLLKYLTGFPEEVYGKSDDEAISENIKKLVKGLVWKK